MAVGPRGQLLSNVGIYNCLPAEIKCPRCGVTGRVVIDLYFGLRNLIDYQLGDTVEWRPGKSVQKGGQPHEGTMDGEGYAECPECGKDYFLLVHVRNDKIVSVSPDPNRAPYIS